jgi:hypothetical protein
MITAGGQHLKRHSKIKDLEWKSGMLTYCYAARSVEECLKTMGIRNRRRKSQDRDQCRAIVIEAKVHRGL